MRSVFCSPLCWAASCGIAEGSDGKFRPEEALTREQLAMILYRYEKHSGGGFRGMWMFRLNYTDTAKLSDGAYEPMCWMTMKGIYIPRADNSLDPAENATRAEAAGWIDKARREALLRYGGAFFDPITDSRMGIVGGESSKLTAFVSIIGEPALPEGLPPRTPPTSAQGDSLPHP